MFVYELLNKFVMPLAKQFHTKSKKNHTETWSASAKTICFVQTTEIEYICPPPHSVDTWNNLCGSHYSSSNSGKSGWRTTCNGCTTARRCSTSRRSGTSSAATSPSGRRSTGSRSPTSPWLWVFWKMYIWLDAFPLAYNLYVSKNVDNHESPLTL